MEPEREEDMLSYSQHTLTSTIQSVGDGTLGMQKYLEGLKYSQLKEFPTGLEWFNVSEALTFAKQLKGKIVLLDFFTYCCINCMQNVPPLSKLQEQFNTEDGFVLLGVHSAKFTNEKTSSNILAAVQRYSITYPVVNDCNQEIWKNCDVHCWPTMLLVGPTGRPILCLMGEGHTGQLRSAIKLCLQYYKSRNEISTHKLPASSAYHLLPDLKGPLLFPGKITNFQSKTHGEILAVSDSGNNRVLILTLDGGILHEIGTGRAGSRDGPFDICEFNNPQGLVFKDEDTVFVADTGNHTIRLLNLKMKRVESVAGTGVLGGDKKGGRLGTKQILASPWDLALWKEVLLIANAGTHQIWALFLEDTTWWKAKNYPAGSCIAIAGNGREENKNNSYPMMASFCQPSGLALSINNKEVYIADSESSSVRKLSLEDGKVSPMVGASRNPQNLFTFGDQDGTLFDARLQHVLGVAISKDEKNLYVADTYNHKIKHLDSEKNTISTLITPPGTFNEPNGLCVSLNNTKLYIADTNNHSIKIASLNTNGSIESIKKMELRLEAQESVDGKTRHQVLEHQSMVVSDKGGKVVCNIQLVFEKGLELTEEAPQSWVVKVPGATWAALPKGGDNLKNIDVVVSVPQGKEGQVDFVFNLVTCAEDVCMPKQFIVRIPIAIRKDGKTSANSSLKVHISPNDLKIN